MAKKKGNDYPVEPVPTLTLDLMHVIQEQPDEKFDQPGYEKFLPLKRLFDNHQGEFLKRLYQAEKEFEAARVQWERDKAAWERENKAEKVVDVGEEACRRLLQRLIKEKD